MASDNGQSVMCSAHVRTRIALHFVAGSPAKAGTLCTVAAVVVHEAHQLVRASGKVLKLIIILLVEAICRVNTTTTMR